MASVAFTSERDCETNNTQLHHLKRKVTCLQSETDLLTRIIQLNEATLEEINELVVTQLKKNERQSISELVMQLNSQEGQIGKEYGLSQTISQQISKRIDDAAQSIYRDFNRGYQNLMIEHYDELNQLKKTLKLESIRKIKENQQDCDTSIEEYTSGRAIFEIPIEMQVLKEVTDTDVQVDLFSSSRSLIYQVPVEMHQIFEIPVELKQIYQIPIELNTQHFVERNRIYEIPVDIDEVYEVNLGGQSEGEKVIFENVIVNEKQFLKYEEEINLLKKEIERLNSELILMKVEGSLKKIYEIPVEMDYLGSEDLNKSQCHVDMPADIEIESQPNLDNPIKYNSLKQGSKVSTQVCTRPDLDIESPHRANIDHKNSLLVSTPGAIQQVESLASANSKLRESFANASSIRNFNLLINQNLNCEVLPNQAQSQIVFEGGVDMYIYGELVEIEMHIMEDVEKCDQQTQTDFVKERILKIPQIQVVEVPYEVERVVERISKIPVLQIVEIPTVVDQVATNLQENIESKKVKLYSRRNPDEQEQISEKQPALFSSHPDNKFSPPRVIVKQVPTQVIIERQLPVKVITKQVPIQVIIEKEVIVQKVVICEILVEIIVEKEVIVERFIELPQKIVVKEVPYEVIIEKEVIVERVVEKPAKTIIKQVPVEVVIEKIVYVPSPPIVKEIPIEVIIEKEVEIMVNQVAALPQKTIIKQVPYEVILQVEKIVEVPKIIVKQVPIQVIVEQPSKTIIKEVPIEVIVEKIVHVYHEIPVQIPVQLIVEKPVIIQKIVKVPVIVECPVEIIAQKKVPVIREIPYEVVIVEEVQKIVVKEIPVQVQVEVVKIVKEIVEVPVIVYMNAEKPKEEFKEFDLSNLVEQPEYAGKLHSYEAQNQDEPFSNMKLLLQSNDPRVKSEPQHIHHIVEMPVEIIVQKEIEKIKEVIKIKEIPTELVLVEEKETIVYVPVQKIVYVKQIVEIPVEVEVEKTVFVTKIVEIPIQVQVVVYRDRIVEVPVEVLVEKPVLKIKAIPIELMMQEEQSQDAPIEEVIVEQQVFPNSRVKLESIAGFPSTNLLNNNNTEEDAHFEEVYEVPMGINYFNGDVVYQIDATNIRRGSGSFEEFVIHLPQQNIEVAECSAQTDLLPEAKEKIKIMEIPIQVENINYQQVQRQVQHKYRETLFDLKQRYEEEITELHSIMANLQSIILQSNQEKLFLKEKIEANALNEQSLLKEIQLIGKEASAEIEKLKRQIEEVNDEKMQEVDEFQREIERLSRLKVNKVPTEQPRGKIWELPIEVILEHETNELAIQTEDINLGPFEVLEIPIQLQATPLTEQEVLIPEEQPAEQVNLYAQRQYSIFQLVDFGCQVETIYKMIFELPVEMKTENEVVSVEIQTEFTVAQSQEIVLFRYTDCNPYDLEVAEQIQLYEVPSEDVQEHPVIYEIATEIEIVKDCVDSHAQTEPFIQEKIIYEVPVEYKCLPQTQEAGVQATEAITLSSQGSLSEEEKELAQEQQQQEEFVMTGRSSKGFKEAWKGSTLRSENKGSIFKKKPNSEYFTSRIFEIPVEIAINKENINMEIQTQEEKVLKSIQVQTETSQIDVRERLLEDAGFSRTVLSRQREITLANMKIVEAFEPVQVAAVTPKKSQKQIARLGSDNQQLNIYHTFSNAQSITPNQFDASSSYDKFPVPNINIHNISLIKKSSLHSQNKFFGSLDIREELLSQDEALASVRFASKKLTGFEQEESSQEGDIQGLSREMIIEENETIVSRDRDINRIQTPNLEPHDLNFSEYATLKEKLYEPEEEKVSHQELYEAAQTELDNIRRRLEKKAEEVAQLKVEFDRETCKYQEEIRKLNEQVNYLHKENRQQALSGEAARTRVAQLEEGKVKLEKQVQMLFDNWEKLREEHLKSESSSTKEIQRLRNIISEKIAEIKESKSDEHHQKEIFQTQLNEYRDLVDRKSEVIDGLEEELQRRGDRIEQLIEGLEEMRKNIANHNNQVDTAAIYEQEFQRVKEGFQEEKRELNYQIYELKETIQQLKDSIKEETRKNEELQTNIVDLQRAVQEARHQYSSLHHLKSELENNYMQGVKCLNQELEEMKDLVKEKDQIIQHRIGSSIEPPSSKMRIQYLSKQASQISPHDSNKSLQAYSRKLQQLLRKYQRVIVENQGTIEQLQEKVYEYLKDALEKEQQAQGLYMKLVDYENTINNILVEKVTLDIENKRLAKQIELSEKKLNALGNRLIEVARKRAEYDSDDEYYE